MPDEPQASEEGTILKILSRDTKISLRSVLAAYYPFIHEARRLAVDAGLNVSHIAFDPKAITNWFNIIEYASSQNKIDDIITIALQEYPDDDILQLVRSGSAIPALEGLEPSIWRGAGSAQALEKILGSRSTLVPVNYLEIGLLRARSVVRVRLNDGSSGTGFLIEGETLLTNHHVLQNVETARTATVQFNYQQSATGLDMEIEEYTLLPDQFFRSSIPHDWSAVRVNGTPSSKWGTLTPGRSPTAPGDHVNIIQHAGGGQKQVSFLANVVVYADDNCLQYLTDTLPGSSGAPVFDASWNLVGIHHSGGWIAEPNSPRREVFYRNQGTPIARVFQELT